MIQNEPMPLNTKLVVAPEWRPVLQKRRLDTVAAVYACEPGTVVAHSRSTEVRRVELGDRIVFIKKYWVTKPSQIISGVSRGAVFGKSKVRREFDNLARLRAWGMDAPAPVAYGEERRAGCLVRSCLISEAIPEARAFDELIRGGYRDVVPLADYVRRLHDHRFVHCDLFWRNIILSGSSLDHFYLIDAHKGHIWRNELAGRAHDLATLDAPAPWFFRRTERLRFLRRYLGRAKLTAADKKLARLVLNLAAPLRDRQLRRVRSAR